MIIVVVEDSNVCAKLIIHTIQVLLTHNTHHCIKWFKTPDEALRYFNKDSLCAKRHGSNIGLVFMDMNLTVDVDDHRNGRFIINYIRKILCRKYPIVIYSGTCDKEVLVCMTKYKDMEYIKKPVDMFKLMKLFKENRATWLLEKGCWKV